MEDMDLEMEDLEERDEQQNRTFVLLVAVLGGLLLIGIIAFCAWAFIIGPRMIAGPTPAPTETVIADVAPTTEPPTLGEGTPTEMPPGVTPTQTAPPSPTATAPAGPSPTEGVEVTTTETTEETPEASPTATTIAAAGETATATPTQGEEPPADTGIGAFTAVLLAGGLLLLLAVVRRLRIAS